MVTLKKFKAVFVRVVIYLHVATVCNVRSLWNWAYEPVGFRCEGPFNGDRNDTGIEVLVYGFAKTGTTQTSHTLDDLFPGKSYHSEDFHFHIWSPHVDEFWSRPENGGGAFPWHRLATPAYPAYHGHSWWPRKFVDRPADPYVWDRTFPEVVEKMQRCGVKTLAFDGVEENFWDVYNASPNAKVVMLDWRPFAKWYWSASKFSLQQYFGLLAVNYCNVGIHFLPWNALILPFWDWLEGDHIKEWMASGNRLITHSGTLMLLFRMSMTERRFINHWSSGFGRVGIVDEESYEAFWQTGRDRIPASRRFHFDLRKHTKNDLCSFLGIEGRPGCDDEPIPKDTPVLLGHETTYPWTFPCLFPLLMLLHYLNYQIFYGVLYSLGRWIRALFALFGVECGRRGGKKRKGA